MDQDVAGRENQAWDVAEMPDEEVYAQAKAWGLDPVWVRVLFRRGIDPQSFINDIQAPRAPGDDSLGEMGASRAWVHELLTSREPVLIYADLDVDGLSAAAILSRFLSHRSHPHSVLLTNR